MNQFHRWLPAALTARWSGLPLRPLDQALAAFLQQTEPSPDPRHLWLAALASHQFGAGHTCLDIAALGSDVAAALGWDAAAVASLPTDLAQAVDSLPWTQGDASPLVLDGTAPQQRLYLRRAWEAERSIVQSVQARLAAPQAVPDDLANRLQRLFAGNDSDGEPDWQRVACALAARSRLTLITGGPGTGKTTTVVRLLALLHGQAQGRPLRVQLAAPTGKAAARLSESIASAVNQLPADLRPEGGMTAVTLHRLLKLRPGNAQAEQPLAADLVVVDEASMIDLEMMARLLRAVPPGARLVLLGDRDQLASVEAGAVMAQLCEGAEAGGYDEATVQWVRDVTGQNLGAWKCAANTPALPLAQQTVMLRRSRRFAAGSGIGQWARHVNAGQADTVRALWQDCPEWSSGEATDVTRVGPSPATPAQSQGALAALVRHGWRELMDLLVRQTNGETAADDAAALQALQALSRFQLLCALRDGPQGVQALNALAAQQMGLPTQGWYAGRPVMVTHNDYDLGLMNGDVGLCLPNQGLLRVAFADGAGGVRWVLPSRLDAVDTVFAMTVHKSQGSEFEHVALVLPAQASPVLTRELLYTGITRARSRLSLWCPSPAVLEATVLRKVLRSGGLAQGLRQT